MASLSLQHINKTYPNGFEAKNEDSSILNTVQKAKKRIFIYHLGGK